MSESMVERVARAIGNSSVGALLSNEQLHKAARAAIAAMREPTEDMLIAGGVNVNWQDTPMVYESWPAMIDTALTPAKVDEAG